MTFFNKKEEVIQVELTQYGKYLLSMGRWKPVYYAFYDDNILYDGAHGGVDEPQNSIEPRIQENTPQLKPQHTFTGRETDFLQTYKKQILDTNERTRIKMDSPVQRDYSLVAPLGTADNISQNAPRWKPTLLEGEIEKATHFLTSSYQTLDIPQIDCDITYNTSIKNISATEFFAEGPADHGELDSEAFTDGSYVQVDTDPFIMWVQEMDTVFEKENFDIEVYRSGTAGYVPLQFKKRPQQVINNLLVPISTMTMPLDDTYVEYYFDLLADAEISKVDLCKSITQLKSQNRYVDIGIQCPEVGPVYTLDPYIDAAPDPTICDDD